MTETGSDGATRGVRGSLSQHGGSIEGSSNATGRDEDDRSLGVSYSEQRDADGEVVGRDVAISAGRGPISGELSGGYTFRVDDAAEQADGSFRVTWQVQLRGGGSGSGSGSAGGGGGGLAGTVTRSGTQVFAGGSRAENRAAAEAYRADFRDHAIREFERAVGRELGTVAWWRAQPAGTARTVAIGGTLSAQASASLLRTLRLGGSGEFSPSSEAQVTRGDGNQVTVVQTWALAGGGALSAGNLVSVTAGGERRRQVSETFAVDMAAGEAAFAAFLRHEHPIEERQDGVRIVSRRETDSSGSRLGAGVAVLGGLRGGSGTGEVVETRYGEDGRTTEARTQTGQENFEGSTVFGDYARRRMEVEAPDSDADYTISTNLHGTSGEESASMLGRDTEAGRAGSRAESSGNWIVGEGLTQDEALRFHRNLLRRYPAGGDGPGLGHPLRGVWSALREVGTDDDRLTGDEHAAALQARRRARGAAIAAFLSEDGRDNMRLVRDVAGGTDETQYLRLFHRGEEDLTAVGDRSAEDIAAGEDSRRRVATFLGRDRSRELEAWIRARQEGPVSAADVTEARSRMADMDARIAQIANVDNYTDLPPATRAETVGRYRGYRDQLAAIVRRAGDAEASDMSADGQAHHDELRALQVQVDDLHAQAERVREDVVRQRRRWGQMHGEAAAEGTLPPNVASRTEAMWSSAEGAYVGGVDAEEAADARLATSLGSEETRGELDQRAAYRSAQGELERAASSFRTAREEMERLARVYDRYDQYTRGELTEPEAREPAPEASAAADAAAPEAPAPEAPAPVPAPARREPARARRRRADAAEETAGAGEATAAAERAGPFRGRAIDNSALVARIPSTPGGAPRTGRVTMSSGLVVELSALRVLPGAPPDAQHRIIWYATMTIVTPIPGADSFSVPWGTAGSAGSIQLHDETVPNAAGQGFRCLVFRD